ncbi:hypothetical protein QYE76_062136 [Lolium multiflorum]|uniref:Uncharacterized protein n=1 Tax=Lolium multiflorum TaxID=4521 RepID=A0AAD8S241_LOLMU|nr:hypothetical protein QYE76_062136 [Lolium multiflorum]
MQIYTGQIIRMEGTAIHFAALHGHARCLRLVRADYVPSIPNFLNQTNHRSSEDVSDVPSPCACRLCAKHTKLLKPDELHRSSQEVSDADFDDEYVRVPCLFLLFFIMPIL